MDDDSLNYPLAPPWTVDPGFPPITQATLSLVGQIFYFLFFIFCAESKDTRSPNQSDVSAPVRVAPATAHQTHSTPPFGPIRRAGSGCSRCFPSRDESFLHPVLTEYAPIPTVAALMHYLIISPAVRSFCPSIHLGPLVRCKLPPGFDELNGVCCRHDCQSILVSLTLTLNDASFLSINRFLSGVRATQPLFPPDLRQILYDSDPLSDSLAPVLSIYLSTV